MLCVPKNKLADLRSRVVSSGSKKSGPNELFLDILWAEKNVVGNLCPCPSPPRPRPCIPPYQPSSDPCRPPGDHSGPTDTNRLKILKCVTDLPYQPTDLLTGVGARDAYASKKLNTILFV